MIQQHNLQIGKHQKQTKLKLFHKNPQQKQKDQHQYQGKERKKKKNSCQDKIKQHMAGFIPGQATSRLEIHTTYTVTTQGKTTAVHLQKKKCFPTLPSRYTQTPSNA